MEFVRVSMRHVGGPPARARFSCGGPARVSRRMESPALEAWSRLLLCLGESVSGGRRDASLSVKIDWTSRREGPGTTIPMHPDVRGEKVHGFRQSRSGCFALADEPAGRPSGPTRRPLFLHAVQALFPPVRWKRGEREEGGKRGVACQAVSVTHPPCVCLLVRTAFAFV